MYMYFSITVTLYVCMYIFFFVTKFCQSQFFFFLSSCFCISTTLSVSVLHCNQSTIIFSLSIQKCSCDKVHLAYHVTQCTSTSSQFMTLAPAVHPCGLLFPSTQGRERKRDCIRDERTLPYYRFGRLCRTRDISNEILKSRRRDTKQERKQNRIGKRIG